MSVVGTVVPANATLVYQSAGAAENFTGDSFTYTAVLDDGSTATVCDMFSHSFCCFIWVCLCCRLSNVCNSDKS